ncbi:DUF305 domain-containing protein [Microvirga sp. STR05]|uniref:DUF305 domain-containing protein n=1 Tax=Hymenobacter duratus TaxID=2771356 RepID=A0ABR8JK27_9BACT|nr:DUF305 domain-containing protein [Hymenobacter duratus]MBD2717203.1 DUF305 domain-containing protein [Hymenobacter duratus]MBR7952122.1 DUF305 domain-containing protein [Microvirga sp. STR05]
MLHILRCSLLVAAHGRCFRFGGARLLAALLMALAVSGCTSEPDDSATHEAEIHGTAKPAPASATAAAPLNLADSLQFMVRELDAVRRLGCWDEDFAALMAVHHAGAQRLAAVQLSRGKDSTLRAMAQQVLKSHEKDTHVLALALKREPPAGQEYRPGNRKDPFVRRITAALAPLRQLPVLAGSPDADFATLMALHHRSGVALAQAELAFGRNAELREAARRIVRDQQPEIKQFQRWLQTHPTLTP